MSEEKPIMEEEDEIFEPEEDRVATDAEELKPKPPTKSLEDQSRFLKVSMILKKYILIPTLITKLLLLGLMDDKKIFRLFSI